MTLCDTLFGFNINIFTTICLLFYSRLIIETFRKLKTRKVCRKNSSHLLNPKKMSRSGRTAAAPETSKPIEPIQREGVFARALTPTVIFVLDAFLSARSLSFVLSLRTLTQTSLILIRRFFSRSAAEESTSEEFH